MATTVYDIVTLELQDGTEVQIRPLPIKQLKVFMKKLGDLGKPENEDSEEEDEFLVMDQVVTLARLCLEKNAAAKNVEDWEEALDMPTAYRVIEYATGVRLDDPKLIETAMTMSQESVGTN